jgi:hypothetical protein
MWINSMAKKRKIYIALALILVVFLTYRGYERCLSRNPTPREDEKFPSENWKEYESIVRIWPQLKKEKIESIRFCTAKSLEYGYDIESDFRKNTNTFGYRERDANVVRWWPCRYKVPKEKLAECIKIIDRAMKKANREYQSVSPEEKMLIITKKGKYIVRVVVIPVEKAGSEAYGEEWDSPELGEFIAKYCIPTYKRGYFVPSKEQTAAILVFSKRKYDSTKSFSAHDSRLAWPPVALFGDKKEAEKLLGRSFEPKMVFEGREWLEKIINEYEVALKDAEETHYRRNDSSTLKGWIVFLTQDEFYDKGIGIDNDMVIGEYIKGSKPLKAYFDELGLTKELLAGEPNAVRHPQADKTPQD